MSALTGQVIRNAGELEALAPDWWALWRRCPTATPFQSPAWLLPWWQHFSPGDLYVVTVQTGGRLIGLAPFYLETGALGHRLLPLGISLSDYHDVLLDPEHAPEAGQALVETAQRAGGWNRWELEELMPGAAALALPCPTGCRDEFARQSACPTLVLDPAGLEAVVPKARQRQLRLAHNRANRRGSLTYEQADAGSAGAFLDALFRLHALRWGERGEAGVLASADVQRFHRAAAPALAAAGPLRLFLLRLGKRVAAVHYGMQDATRAFFYIGGFDPAFAPESPGALILAHAIREAIAEGAREFHFLRGQEAYKYSWGAVDRWNQRRSLCRIEAQHVAAREPVPVQLPRRWGRA